MRILIDWVSLVLMSPYLCAFYTGLKYLQAIPWLTIFYRYPQIHYHPLFYHLPSTMVIYSTTVLKPWHASIQCYEYRNTLDHIQPTSSKVRSWWATWRADTLVRSPSLINCYKQDIIRKIQSETQQIGLQVQVTHPSCCNQVVILSHSFLQL